MEEGTTLHSRFKIPIPCDNSSTSNIRNHSAQAQALREASLFLIDEASMCSKYILECIDRLLRDVTCNKNVPFGGKCIVLAGDFRQTLPIILKSSEAAVTSICLKKSKLWKDFSKFKLNTNMRALANEIEFAKYLLEMGNGKIETIDNDSLIRIPDELLIENNEDLIDFVYGSNFITPQFLRETNCAILCPLNTRVSDINEKILRRVPGN
jgi:hypothetical protein